MLQAKAHAKVGLLGAALFTLAGCGGSTTPMDTVPVDPFADRRQNFATYDAAVADFNATAQTVASLPATAVRPSGTMQYDGVFLATGDARIGSRINGEASFDVSFDGAGAVNGSITNFRRQSDNETLEGTITMVADSLLDVPDRVDMSVVLDGSVILPDGEVLPYAGNMGGTIRGLDAEGASFESALSLAVPAGATENFVTVQIYAQETPAAP